MTVRGAVLFALLGQAATIGSFRARVAVAAPEAPASEASDKEARELFKRAEFNFNLLKFTEALSDYQAAYQAKPLPGFLFNIAQCYRNMGQYERARFFFRRYLVLDPKTPNRPKVENLIADMTRLIDKQETAPMTPSPDVPAASPPAQPPAAAPAPALGLTAAAAQPVNPGNAPLLTTQAPPPQRPTKPIYKRWWFWSGIGAVVVGGTVAALLLTRDDNVPDGSLDPINGRQP